MNKLTSRQKILLGSLPMALATAGDCLLGYGCFGTSSAPDAYMGVSWNVVPDWRYAVSSMRDMRCLLYPAGYHYRCADYDPGLCDHCRGYSHADDLIHHAGKCGRSGVWRRTECGRIAEKCPKAHVKALALIGPALLTGVK